MLLQLAATAIVVYVTCRLFTTHQRPVLGSVVILVLGDIGRSPRIMYHAESFAKNHYHTFLIGYGGASSNLNAKHSALSIR